MDRVLRLALACAVLLFAGGTVVAPHVDPPGTTPHHDEHVASATRLVLLASFAGFRHVDGAGFLADDGRYALASTAATALLAIAILVVWWPRVGGALVFEALAGSRLAMPSPLAPPRASFSLARA